MYLGLGVVLLPLLLDCAVGALYENQDGSYSADYNQGYNIDFMKELCRYVGVSYVRNPQDPLCKYIWCWNGYPYTMDCAPGRMVHPYFYWSEKDPCTEPDTGERCLLGVLKHQHQKVRTSTSRQSQEKHEKKFQPKAEASIEKQADPPKDTMVIEKVEEDSNVVETKHSEGPSLAPFTNTRKYLEVKDTY